MGPQRGHETPPGVIISPPMTMSQAQVSTPTVLAYW
jgi:hypothetical protein